QLSHNFFFFQAEDGIRSRNVTGVQTCALPISIAPSVAVATMTRAPECTYAAIIAAPFEASSSGWAWTANNRSPVESGRPDSETAGSCERDDMMGSLLTNVPLAAYTMQTPVAAVLGYNSI